MGPDTTDAPISNTIRTIVKRRSAKSGVGEQRDWPIERTRPRRPPRRLPLPDPLVADLLVYMIRGSVFKAIYSRYIKAIVEIAEPKSACVE